LMLSCQESFQVEVKNYNHNYCLSPLLDPLKLTNFSVWLVKLLHGTQFTTNLGE
jgi:hypothetical protein